MKISISLSDDDLAYLDAETASGTFPSRSAAVAAAIDFLRRRGLIDEYAEAFDEWAGSDDARLWDGVVGDGVA